VNVPRSGSDADPTQPLNPLQPWRSALVCRPGYLATQAVGQRAERPGVGSRPRATRPRSVATRPARPSAASAGKTPVGKPLGGTGSQLSSGCAERTEPCGSPQVAHPAVCDGPRGPSHNLPRRLPTHATDVEVSLFSLARQPCPRASVLRKCRCSAPTWGRTVPRLSRVSAGRQWSGRPIPPVSGYKRNPHRGQPHDVGRSWKSAGVVGPGRGTWRRRARRWWASD
jgi:hypothetical protein